MARIIVPDLNPLQFVPETLNQAPRYNSRHHEDWRYEETLHSWQYPVGWVQPWQKTDSIRLQITSELAPISVVVRNALGAEVHRGNMVQGLQNALQPTFFIYSYDLPLTAFASGLYEMILEIGTPIVQTLRSNVFLVEERIADSLLVEYRHYRYLGNTYFETGFAPMLRTYGTLVYEKPGSHNTVYEDQELDMTLLNAKPFSLYRLYVGGPEGIPDFFVHKFNTLLCCSDFLVDGRAYTKAQEGSQLEEKAEEEYPLRGWSIELRQRTNRSYRTFQQQGLSTGLTVVINVQGRGFISESDTTYYDVIDID